MRFSPSSSSSNGGSLFLATGGDDAMVHFYPIKRQQQQQGVVVGQDRLVVTLIYLYRLMIDYTYTNIITWFITLQLMYQEENFT